MCWTPRPKICSDGEDIAAKWRLCSLGELEGFATTKRYGCHTYSRRKVLILVSSSEQNLTPISKGHESSRCETARLLCCCEPDINHSECTPSRNVLAVGVFSATAWSALSFRRCLLRRRKLPLLARLWCQTKISKETLIMLVVFLISTVSVLVCIRMPSLRLRTWDASRCRNIEEEEEEEE